ncbi:uncharacterized protein BX664DRAFT_387951 [Halteromyces radiatus]|uniref:uncharacterized protein n=1 Tax=Halteromyces radiatus TaxID=101107 RepID=UPI0022205D5F|nr:uncharacterized protein BX664DRAFT_387951 [Halteromyces radiatus]KAI8082809.1 hypothetical protein BX664DRAFT_387951 [Halteromyces radiatus]
MFCLGSIVFLILLGTSRNRLFNLLVKRYLPRVIDQWTVRRRVNLAQMIHEKDDYRYTYDLVQERQSLDLSIWSQLRKYLKTYSSKNQRSQEQHKAMAKALI